MFKNKELIDNLSWNCSNEVQEKAIEDLSKLHIKDIKYLIQPNGKECWSNAAIAIKNIITKNKILNQEEKESLFSLMKWTQDLNWPGALIIVDTLKILDTNLVKRMIKESLKIALKDKDECRVYSLSIIIEKLDYDENDFTDLLNR